ncbi:thiolase [Geotalea daltonii FRC-32]|uniref:Thiolase n=1 Tax=Geotalea daltonii (strain DSM 22248 / JCM 15807 / FRC-32) TaxID=316067 RepID=B9M8K2_GEODF|nr:thiolase family protein [Geotalea daltonii]ACM18537.1 thiolase [Geotalea daltonii FRC-32]
MLQKAYIPYRGYYSTPFAKWQGTLANENAIVLGAATSKRFFESKGWDPKTIDYVLVGSTVYQKQWFYSGPWAAALMGAEASPGILVSQACSTSTFAIYQAGMGVETGLFNHSWCLMADRLSNGPHAVWPNPNGPGGQQLAEDWVMDNFGRDPWAGGAMIQTAENVAKEYGVSREECDAVTLRRQEQYLDALARDREFQQRYMFPAEVQISKKKSILLEADEGITTSTREGLATLKPVLPDGVHTFGAQTHPADGNAGICVTTREKAKELSTNPGIEIQVVSFGYARTKKAHMAAAVAPSAQMALDQAGIKVKDLGAVKTHNPFAANDIVMAKVMGLDLNNMNNYGSSLIFGHPQAATGARLMIEGIEELAVKGGGYLLFSGCAAGDTAASVVLKVS